MRKQCSEISGPTFPDWIERNQDILILSELIPQNQDKSDKSNEMGTLK
jgi:hypothetical protein